MATIGVDNLLELETRLEKARHVKYWTRCLKTLLPHQYTSLDSNRLYLAYFIISALDLLDSLTTVCKDDERRDYANWIYRCQKPNGGFRMWPGTDFGERANEANAKWDPANVPATYFALAALLILGDDFKRVRRRQTLQWLRSMQRADGSFGETLVDGRIEGGRDPRYGYCATGIRYVLRGTKHGVLKIEGHEVQDIDVDAFVCCVRAAESYDGGIADEPFHEPHAGYTFCSLGALSFLGRLNTGDLPASDTGYGPSKPHEVILWLVYRQTDLLDPDATLDSELIDRGHVDKNFGSQPKFIDDTDAPLHQSPDKSVACSPFTFDTECAGMNGRTNKVADTCYAWWASAPMHILGQPLLYDRRAIRKYLLEKTQHPVLGGFGKFPGDLPDLYHSYLGLTALSLAGSKDVKEVDAGMCVSKEARARLAGLWKYWGLEQSVK